VCGPILREGGSDVRLRGHVDVLQKDIGRVSGGGQRAIDKIKGMFTASAHTEKFTKTAIARGNHGARREFQDLITGDVPIVDVDSGPHVICKSL
jgi:hypothetical protein